MQVPHTAPTAPTVMHRAKMEDGAMAEKTNHSGCGCLGVFVAVVLSAWLCWSFGPMGLLVVLVAALAYVAVKAC